MRKKTAATAEMIVMRESASLVNAVIAFGALEAAYATVGDRRLMSIVPNNTNNFIFFHMPNSDRYGVAPNAPVAKSAMTLVNTNAPSTTANPMAE